MNVLSLNKVLPDVDITTRREYKIVFRNSAKVMDPIIDFINCSFDINDYLSYEISDTMRITFSLMKQAKEALYYAGVLDTFDLKYSNVNDYEIFFALHDVVKEAIDLHNELAKEVSQ